MENFTRSIGNYIIPVLFIILGLVFTIKYMMHLPAHIPNQPSGMLWGGLLLFLAGVISLPVIQALIGQKIALGLAVVFGLASVFLYIGLFNTVDDEMEYQNTLDKRTRGVVQRLKDIRAAESAYSQVYGTYTDNFDTLIKFIMEPNIPVPFKLGQELNDSIGGGKIQAYIDNGYVLKQADVDSVANMLSMSAEELWDLIEADNIVYKIRDTSYVSFYDYAFAPDVRHEKDLPVISMDSLPYNPFTGEKFIMKTGMTEVAGLKQPTILVKDPTPYGREGINMKRDTLMFGSLTEAHTDGNWKKLE